MFKGSYQRKLLTILYSGGSNPLEIWDIKVKNGWTRRLKDDDLGCIVFEVAGTNVATAYVVSPPEPRASLAVSLPFFTMLVKNLKRYFTFEIQIIDDKKMRRRFRFSNYQSCTKVRPFACSVPLALKPGWNQLQLNLANFTTRAYGTNYLETQRVQIHANCRVRRVYFSDRIYAEEELPKDYRILTNLRQAPAPPPPEKRSCALAPPPPTVEPQVSLHSSTTTKRTSKGDISVPSEMIVAETSFKSSDKQPSGSNGTRSVGVISTSRSVHETTSTAGGDLVRATSVLSTASKRSLQHSEHRTVTFEPPVLESPEEYTGDAAAEDLPEFTATADVEEGVAEDIEHEQLQEPAAEIPEEAADAEVDSPRTEAPESEYTESEPPLESDAEEVVESAAEDATDEPPTDNESPDESP